MNITGIGHTGLLADLIRAVERAHGKPLPEDIPQLLRLAFHAEYEVFHCAYTGCDVEVAASRRDGRPEGLCSHPPEGVLWFCPQHRGPHAAECEWERRNRELITRRGTRWGWR